MRTRHIFLVRQVEYRAASVTDEKCGKVVIVQRRNADITRKAVEDFGNGIPSEVQGRDQ